MQEHLHQCKVRQLLAWRNEWGLQKFREYVVKSNFDKQTLSDFYDQWQLGNKGEQGCWKNSLSQQQDLDI